MIKTEKRYSFQGHILYKKAAATCFWQANTIFRTPLKAVSDVPMKYNGRAYYGSFIFKISPNGIKVSNIVDIEQYLRGVIKAEMSPKWDIEALKAQSVLARTFAAHARRKTWRK